MVLHALRCEHKNVVSPMNYPLAELIRFALTVLVPAFVVIAIMVFAILRQRTPKDMRWPRKKDKGRRASVRDVKPLN